MTQPSKILRRILSRIQELTAQGQRSLAVFDLDSTLFDVSPRLQKILHDFACDPQNQKRFRESCEILKNIETLRSDWGIKAALVRAGLDGHHPDFHRAIKTFWIEHFFSNGYLQYDLPYEGAVDYVKAVAAAGAEIVYLTGREAAKMKPGSEETLKKWNFPLGPKAELVMRMPQDHDDAEFKKDWFSKIPDGVYKGLWFFENEPLNVNLVREHHQHVEIVFFHSTHSGQAAPPLDLPKIMHYLLEEES